MKLTREIVERALKRHDELVSLGCENSATYAIWKRSPHAGRPAQRYLPDDLQSADYNYIYQNMPDDALL